MNRTKKFALNTTSAAALQVITMIAGFITPRIMLTCYGSEINGLVSSVSQFVSYFTIVEAGLTNAVVYALYKPLAVKDTKSIAGIVRAAQKFYYQTGGIFLFLVAILAIVYPIYIKTDILAPGLISILVFVSAVNSALDFFALAKYSAILTADQKAYVKNVGTIIQVVVNTFIVVLLAGANTNIVLLKAIALLSIFIRSLFLYIYVRKYYPYLDKKVEPIFNGLEKRWSAFYLQITQVIQRGAPTVLGTIFLTLKDISVYTIFNMIIMALSNILEILSSGLASQFGEIISLGDQKLFKRVYSTYESVYYTFITMVYSLAFLLIMPFVRVYTRGVADTNYDQPIIGALFVLNTFFYTLKNPQGMLIYSAGLYKEVKIPTTIQGLIIVVGGVILTPLMGLSGILCALCLSNIYRCIDLYIFVPKYITHIPVTSTIKRVGLSFGKLIIACFIVKILPEKIVNNYIDWFVMAIEYGIIVVILALISWICFEREEAKDIKNRIFRIIRNKR